MLKEVSDRNTGLSEAKHELKSFTPEKHEQNKFVTVMTHEISDEFSASYIRSNISKDSKSQKRYFSHFPFCCQYNVTNKLSLYVNLTGHTA